MDVKAFVWPGDVACSGRDSLNLICSMKTLMVALRVGDVTTPSAGINYILALTCEAIPKIELLTQVSDSPNVMVTC